MSNYKDKNFVAMQALESAAAKEDPSSGEHKLFAEFEENVRKQYSKNLKKLKKLVHHSKKLYDQIFVPTIECTEEIEMGNVLKSYKLYNQQIHNQEDRLSSIKRFATNKVRLLGAEEISGSHNTYVMSYVLIVLFICIEAVINSTLLSQASESGLIGGWLLASAISSVSVIFSLLCGRAFQSLYHYGYTETFNKIFAWLVFSFWLLCSIVGHISVGWYRFALENHPDDASTRWFELFKENFLNQNDFWAWILTIAGLVLAAKAFHIGYEWKKASLLSKLQRAEIKLEKKGTECIDKRKEAKEELKNIKDDILSKDIGEIIKEARILEHSFEIKRIEILDVINTMDKYVTSQNKDIVIFTNIWRTNYSDQEPNVQFAPEILQIDSQEYSLSSHPIMQWINNINNEDIQLEINKMREDRRKEIIQTYAKMYALLSSIADPDSIDTDTLLLTHERNDNE